MSHRPIRLACDIANPNQLREKRTGLPPVLVQGSAAVLQLALFDDGTIVTDPTADFDALTVLVKTSVDATSVLLQKTILADEFTACLIAAWLDDSGQHVAIELSGGDCSFVAGQHYIAIRGITGESFTVLAYGTIKMIETAANPPDSEAAAEFYTRTEVDALFLPLIPDGGTMRIVGGQLQIKDTVTGTWATLTRENGVITLGAEEE